VTLGEDDKGDGSVWLVPNGTVPFVTPFVTPVTFKKVLLFIIGKNSTFAIYEKIESSNMY